MKTKKTTTLSPALAFVQHVWDNVSPKSWQNFNGALHAALKTAISSGMRFDIGDFAHMAKELRLGYWSGENLEWAYSLACGGERGTDNAIAVAALESYLKRDAFLWAEKVKTPSRLHVGSELNWKGERVTVTSFNDAKKSLTACSYKAESSWDGIHRKSIAVGQRVYFESGYRDIEAFAQYDDGTLAVRLSKPVPDETRDIARRFTITAEELNGIRLEQDARRRKHEKAIKAATTLDELDVARKAAAEPGPSAYRHFDIEILQKLLDDKKEEIETAIRCKEETEEYARREPERRAEVERAAQRQRETLERWVAGEEVSTFLNPMNDIRLRRKGDFIETSNGHKVSVKAAKLAWAFVKRHREKGWQQNGQVFDLDAFSMRRIDRDGVEIGCTRIPWGEVDRVPSLLSSSLSSVQGEGEA